MRHLISILALGFVVYPTIATADIVRSCSATLTGGIAKINGEGTCAGKAKANQCRARAHQAIIDCANALWVGRNKDKVPNACKGGRGAGRAVLQWNQVILIPQGNSLRDRVLWNKCCKEKNSVGSEHIGMNVRGDKGCYDVRSLGNIGFDCATDRMKLCPPQRAAPKPPPRAGSD